MNAASGEASLEVPPTSPLTLGMIDGSTQQIFEMLRLNGSAEMPQAGRSRLRSTGGRALFARPSSTTRTGRERGLQEHQDHVGRPSRYDVNTTVVVTGALYPRRGANARVPRLGHRHKRRA
jgi:hypothetical protein